jgi:hypothetical protein
MDSTMEEERAEEERGPDGTGVVEERDTGVEDERGTGIVEEDQGIGVEAHAKEGTWWRADAEEE